MHQDVQQENPTNENSDKSVRHFQKISCAPHPKHTVCATPKKYRVRHTQQIPCAPHPKQIVCATPKKNRVRHTQKYRVRHSQKSIVCATPEKYRVRHTQQIPCAPLPKKSEDQSGGPGNNLEVFSDEVSFQYFQKT